MKYIPPLLFVLLLIGCSPIINTQKNKDTATELIGTSDLYENCSGNTFVALCADESCIAPDLERRVFNSWKVLFKEKYVLSEAQFNALIDIADVSMEGHPPYFFWSVAYIYHVDWIRSRETQSINLSSFGGLSSLEELTDEQINAKIKAYVNHHRKRILHFDRVITRVTLASLLQKTYYGIPITYDFCDIRMGSDHDGILLGGRGTINQERNRCVSGSIDLINGTVDFDKTVCWMD